MLYRTIDEDALITVETFPPNEKGISTTEIRDQKFTGNTLLGISLSDDPAWDHITTHGLWSMPGIADNARLAHNLK